MHPETVAPAVRVIFRAYRGTNDIVAVFPDLVADARGNVTTYEHIGQHGAGAYDTMILLTRPAKPAEYAPLRAELERIGYQLTIATRRHARRNPRAF